MIDSHCHLDHEPIRSNLNQILKRSRDVGIEKLLTICTTDKGFTNILKLINLDPIIYGTYGIHPHEAKNYEIPKNQIKKNVNLNDKIIGVGETGLDFYYNNSDKNTQIASFTNHIEAAIDLNIPIVVHSRSAETETFEILSRYKKHSPKILMHCFTGSLEFAKRLFDLNAYFSASGIITFKNSTELQNTFKIIPQDKILIETDSPFLSPHPFRGKKNEPSFIVHTLSKLASIRNLNIKKTEKITTENFHKLFF